MIAATNVLGVIFRTFFMLRLYRKQEGNAGSKDQEKTQYVTGVVFIGLFFIFFFIDIMV
jgi:hypothetical protein